MCLKQIPLSPVLFARIILEAYLSESHAVDEPEGVHVCHAHSHTHSHILPTHCTHTRIASHIWTPCRWPHYLGNCDAQVFLFLTGSQESWQVQWNRSRFEASNHVQSIVFTLLTSCCIAGVPIVSVKMCPIASIDFHLKAKMDRAM